MTNSLVGRRVLVTGASSGIGAAVVEALVSEGASVAMVARRADRLEALHDRLGKATLPLVADVTDERAMLRVGELANEAFGGIDGIFANAGIMHVGHIGSGNPTRWREVIETDLLGALFTVRAVLPHFANHGNRDVVLISSTASLAPPSDVGIYSASKAGVNAMATSLRLELAPRGIRVCLLIPGIVTSEITDHGIFESREPLRVGKSDTIDILPADQVADVVTFVLSRPTGLCLNEIVVRPIGQLAP